MGLCDISFYAYSHLQQVKERENCNFQNLKELSNRANTVEDSLLCFVFNN